MTRPRLTGLLLCCLTLLTACQPQDTAAQTQAVSARFTPTELKDLGQGLQIPFEDLPELLPPPLRPKLPSDCGPAGLCVKPDLEILNPATAQPTERMMALLSNQCGPNAYCTPEARDEIINEMFANIGAVVKAILANTCTAAKCDESIFVETDPLSIALYQKFCAAGGECTVKEAILDLCVVAICNRPDMNGTADELATPPEKPPPTTCKGNDEQCKKDQLGAAQDAHMAGLDALEAAQEKTESAKKDAEDAQRAVENAKTEQEKKDAQAKLQLAQQALIVAQLAEKAARAELMGADVNLIRAAAAVEAGHSSDGTFGGWFVNTAATVVDMVGKATEGNVGAVVETIYHVITYGTQLEHSSERYTLERMQQEERERNHPTKALPLLAQSAPPDPLNIIIPVLTGLPEYLKSARQCAATEICVGLVAYVQAALNFQLAHDTEKGVPLSDVFTIPPRPGSPGGASIDVGTLPDVSKVGR